MLGCAQADSSDALHGSGRGRLLRARRLLTPLPITRPTCGTNRRWIEVEKPAHGRQIGLCEGPRLLQPHARSARGTDRGGLRGITELFFTPPKSKEARPALLRLLSNGISMRAPGGYGGRRLRRWCATRWSRKQVLVVRTGWIHTARSRPRRHGPCRMCAWTSSPQTRSAVHDIEAALVGTSIGVRLSGRAQEAHGHSQPMRAITPI